MKQLLLLGFLLVNLAYGYNYNALLLKAQSAIFPKILLLDQQLGDKLVDGKIVYTILYEEGDELTAAEVRTQIIEQFDHHLDQYPLEIRTLAYSDVSDALRTTAIYALNSESQVNKIAKIAMSQGIITFSYDIINLQNGLLFSLMVEKFTVLYLNKEMLQNYRVDFVDSLYQIVRFSNEKHHGL